MLPHIIGLNGFAGSGKDTVAKYFETEHRYHKITMADAVKDVLSIVFCWDRDLLQGETIESREWRKTPDVYWSKQLGYEFTPRMAMQQIGTDLFRNHFNPDIWCMIVRKKIDEYGGKIIVPDIRFSNEIDLVKSYSSDMLEVQRGDRPEWYNVAYADNQSLQRGIFRNRMESIFPEIHPSEYKWIGINEPKYIVHNNNTLESLYAQLDKYYGPAA